MDRGDALELDVYGLHATVTGAWPEVVDDLRRDFWWFRAAGFAESDLRLRVERRPPDFERFGALRSAFVTPRNVVYQDAETTVVDYFGRAALVVARRSGDALVEGEDPQLVREAANNFLISRIGEHVNARGLVRLHALGLAGSAGGVAVVMPSGGGKSTLALRALETEGCRLLSEDSPLLDRHGRLHPFPLRIGVNPTDADRIPAGLTVRKLERIEFHPKLALDVESFAERIESASQPLRHLVIGSRTLGLTGHLEPLGRRHAVGPLIREAVVGVGVYQGMEFVLQRGWADVAGKSGTAARRALAVGASLRGAQVWRLWVGRDRESNWEALRPLL
jgi:hypothetical protein